MVPLDLDVSCPEAPKAFEDEALPRAARPQARTDLPQPAESANADIRKAIQKPASAAAFATLFVDGYLTPAFGARIKSEVDLLVLGCLIRAGAIDPSAPVYDLARALNLTPTRVRSLILNWQLRSGGDGMDMRGALVQALQKTRFTKDGTLLTFGIENPLLREDVEARLKRRGIFADASFSREIVRLPVDAFAEFLDDLVDEATKRSLHERLIEDHQLPDRSFKALIAGLLERLGEKVAGKAGEAFAGELLVPFDGEAFENTAMRLGSFIANLFKGDAPEALAALKNS